MANPPAGCLFATRPRQCPSLVQLSEESRWGCGSSCGCTSSGETMTRYRGLKTILRPDRLALALTFAAALLLACPSQGFAQDDDWGVERTDLKAKKIERYKKLVDRSADESYAFKQLMKEVGRGSDYDKLVEEYKKKVADNPDDYK